MNAVFIALTAAALAADPAVDAELLKQVVAVGQKTAARLRTEGASWTMRFDLPSGLAVEVDVEQFPKASRQVMRLVAKDQSETLTTIIRRDDQWLVTNGVGTGKFRPFEAPLPIATAYAFLECSDTQVLTKEMAAGVLSVESSDETHVKVGVRGGNERRGNLQLLITQFEELRKELRKKKKDLTSEHVQTLAELKRQQADGFRVTIDRQQGIILDRELPPYNIRCLKFAWKETDNSSEWPLPSKAQDFTQPFSSDVMKDVIQIGYDPAWQPGNPISSETDLVLLNMRDGAVRRVPYPFGMAGTGCFSIDRSKVYLTGSRLDEIHVGLFEVDLTSGKTSELGGAEGRQGVWLAPTLSPNGRYLAAPKGVPGPRPQSQIYMIDLNTSKTKAVGEPMDVYFLDWHPDGRSLICELREPDPKGGKAKSSILQVLANGKTRKLRAGQFLCVMPDGKRLLFKDVEDDVRMKTCNLEGGDARQYGNGFKNFGFPTSSRDGRLLMMRFDSQVSPRPCLIDLETRQIKLLPQEPGMWGVPAWK